MKKKKLKFQNLFICVSIIFIMSCIVFYGGRLIYFYLDSKKDDSIKTFTQILKKNNIENENFKVISTSYYFTNDKNDNYVMYSSILWRIIKIDADGFIYLISDNSLSSLAFGEGKTFKDSYINQWLNESELENSGILRKNMNMYSLVNVDICDDQKDKASNAECKKKGEAKPIGLLDMEDYINTGGSKSFVNTGENFYLVNTNSKKQVWYVDEESGLSTTDGTDIMGIKPVIAVKNDIMLLGGTGTKEDPYQIGEKTHFGSYVKLGDDLWRIYQVEKDTLKLVLTKPLTVSGKELKYAYSNNNYKFDDTKSKTLAYYLNHTYLNSLSYKNSILEASYANGYYGSSTDYDYTKTLKTTIKTKVGLLSIGDVHLTTEANYGLMTGTNKSGSLMYVRNKNAVLSYDDVTNSLSVVPCITIKEFALTKGVGTVSEPYEMEK